MADSFSAGVIERFAAQASRQAATVVEVGHRTEVPRAVADYLRAQALPPAVMVAADAAEQIAWRSVPELQLIDRPIAPDGDAVVTGCHGAVAEAGAVIMLDGHATELNFLAQTHIVLLRASRVFATLEDFWAHLAQSGVADALPRAMNLIVGPSRTADLGVPSRLGAHGPARLHVIVFDADR